MGPGPVAYACRRVTRILRATPRSAYPGAAGRPGDEHAHGHIPANPDPNAHRDTTDGHTDADAGDCLSPAHGRYAFRDRHRAARRGRPPPDGRRGHHQWASAAGDGTEGAGDAHDCDRLGPGPGRDRGRCGRKVAGRPQRARLCQRGRLHRGSGRERRWQHAVARPAAGGALARYESGRSAICPSSGRSPGPGPRPVFICSSTAGCSSRWATC
jgi:hypothetical protein